MRAFTDMLLQEQGATPKCLVTPAPQMLTLVRLLQLQKYTLLHTREWVQQPLQRKRRREPLPEHPHAQLLTFVTV